MSKAIGIDLGTTNSAMAHVVAGDPEIIENAEGSNTTPSIVAVNPADGERFVGVTAKRQMTTNAPNTIFSAKRFIGRRFDDPKVQEDRDLVPFEVDSLPNGDTGIFFDGELRWPSDISANVVRKLKEDAETMLGEKVTQAVITVPAYFKDAQRAATRVAGEIAGLEVLRIVSEPTAAAMAYGLHDGTERTVAVYDLGGGTFDITIMHVQEGVIDVHGTAGDTHLGGDDFDQRIVDWMVDEFEKKEGVNLRSLADPGPMQRLREEAEQAKIDLSSQKTRKIELPFLTTVGNGQVNFVTELTRDRLEQMVDDLIVNTAKLVDEAMLEAGKTFDDIDDVLLVGGMTRMPAIQARVADIFGMEPSRSINPDEVVALGAAIQAGVMQGEVKDIVLVDVTPLSLGTAIRGDIMSVVVPRNTNIPTYKKKRFTTVEDGQTLIRFDVYQGEREMASDNLFIGTVILDGIMPAPRGVPSVEVTFTVDDDGILKVTAKDLGTNRNRHVTIAGRSGIPDDEVQRRIVEAQTHAESDRARRATAELKNDAESSLYKVDRTFKVAKQQNITIDDATRRDILAKAEVVQALYDADNPDLAKLSDATESLEQALLEIGNRLYGRGDFSEL